MKPKTKFPVQYKAIIKRMQSIKPSKYAGTRNFINGNVSYLSPYISRGVISTKQVMEYVLQQDYKPYLVSKFLQELAWRDYYQRIYQALGDKLLTDINHKQPGYIHKQLPVAVYKAQTGIEAIDKLIQQFYETGYMHNHVRMYVAAISCNIAKVYWLRPSQWLYYHLMDGDIASNTCSWQWVAGSFSSKKYYCNQENINRYTLSKQQDNFLDKPYNILVKMEVPEVLHNTIKLSLKTKLPETPLPKIDTSKPTLIYNSYNLDPLWRIDEDVNRVLLLEPSHFKKFPVSDKVIEFIIGLSKNIKKIQLYCGELNDLQQLYKQDGKQENFISKEHPAFTHYTGIKDERDWMFPEITGYYKSFSQFYKKAMKQFKKDVNK